MFRIARSSVDLNQQSAYILSHTPKTPAPTQEVGPAFHQAALLRAGLDDASKAAQPLPDMAPELPDIEALQREADAISDDIQQAMAELERSRDEAQAVRDAANAEAESLLEKARASASERFEAARIEGYARGEAEAMEAGARKTDEEIADLLQRERDAFAALIAEMNARRETMFSSMERHVLQLSLAIAEKIIGKAIDDDDTVFVGMVKSAIEQVKSVGRVTVHVGQEDYQKYYAAGSFSMELFDESVRISVVEDPSLARGGCVVETPDEMIDASIRTQISLIREAFNQGDHAKVTP